MVVAKKGVLGVNKMLIISIVQDIRYGLVVMLLCMCIVILKMVGL